MSGIQGSDKGDVMKNDAMDMLRSVSLNVIIILASMTVAQNCLALKQILSGSGSPAAVVIYGENVGEEKTTGPVMQYALLDLPTMPDEDPDPDIVQVNIDVRMAPVNVNGMTANLFTYNGLIPGPVIRTKTGDTLRIHFQNSLPPTSDVNMLGFTKNITNLHVHGMHVTPMDPGDLPALLNGDMDSCVRWTGSTAMTGSVIARGPPSGSSSWYLVVGCNGMMKGSAGYATAGERILNGMGSCM